MPEPIDLLERLDFTSMRPTMLALNSVSSSDSRVAMCLYSERSNGAMNLRFEREESGYLKFRQFGGEMPPTRYGTRRPA